MSKPIIESNHWVGCSSRQGLDDIFYWIVTRLPCHDRVIDMGCGSGILGLSVANLCQSVTLVDIDPQAIEITRANAERNGITNVEIVQSDVWQNLAGYAAWDVIISFPPNSLYPPTHDRNPLRTYNADWIFHRQLIAELPTFLKPNGHLILCNTLLDETHHADPTHWAAGLQLIEIDCSVPSDTYYAGYAFYALHK